MAKTIFEVGRQITCHLVGEQRGDYLGIGK